MKQKLIILTGQTGTGKTNLALKIAKECGGELISADSRQAYKYLDVITGKDILPNMNFVSADTINNVCAVGFYTIQSIPVWLYDIVDPKTVLSAITWALCAQRAIQRIIDNKKTPVIVGGTYFYIHTLLYGLSVQTGEPDWNIRARLEKKTVTELQIELEKHSPGILLTMNNSDKNNKRRLIRRIELSNSTMSLDPHGGIHEEFDSIMLGLVHKDKITLENAIRNRVEQRIQQGALDEVSTLLRMGYQRTDPGLQTIGYAQLIPVLHGDVRMEYAQEQWVIKERQYAKRQKTLMIKDKSILWYNTPHDAFDYWRKL